MARSPATPGDPAHKGCQRREACVKIEHFEIRDSVMRKEDPTWKFALGASPITEGKFVRLALGDGTEAFGYASATAHMGAISPALEGQLAYLKDSVVGKDCRDIEAILAGLERAMRGAAQAKAGIDCALHDLLARKLGVPLCQLFGGKVRGRVPILRIQIGRAHV